MRWKSWTGTRGLPCTQRPPCTRQAPDNICCLYLRLRPFEHPSRQRTRSVLGGSIPVIMGFTFSCQNTSEADVQRLQIPLATSAKGWLDLPENVEGASTGRILPQSVGVPSSVREPRRESQIDCGKYDNGDSDLMRSLHKGRTSGIDHETSHCCRRPTAQRSIESR